MRIEGIRNFIYTASGILNFQPPFSVFFLRLRLWRGPANGINIPSSDPGSELTFMSNPFQFCVAPSRIQILTIFIWQSVRGFPFLGIALKPDKWLMEPKNLPLSAIALMPA